MTTKYEGSNIVTSEVSIEEDANKNDGSMEVVMMPSAVAARGNTALRGNSGGPAATTTTTRRGGGILRNSYTNSRSPPQQQPPPPPPALNAATSIGTVGSSTNNNPSTTMTTRLTPMTSVSSTNSSNFSSSSKKLSFFRNFLSRQDDYRSDRDNTDSSRRNRQYGSSSAATAVMGNATTSSHIVGGRAGRAGDDPLLHSGNTMDHSANSAGADSHQGSHQGRSCCNNNNNNGGGGGGFWYGCWHYTGMAALVSCICHPSRATLHRMNWFLTSRFWQMILGIFTLILLFGAQVQELFLPKGADMYMDVIWCVSMAVFFTDIIMRCYLEPNYFSTVGSRGHLSHFHHHNNNNYHGRHGSNRNNTNNNNHRGIWAGMGHCLVWCGRQIPIGSFMFWCDFVSSTTLLYNIAFINQPLYDMVTVNVHLNRFGAPVSGLSSINQALPVELELQLLVTIGRTARVARFIRASTVVKTSSKVNLYWIIQHLNPAWYYQQWRYRRFAKQSSTSSLIDGGGGGGGGGGGTSGGGAGTSMGSGGGVRGGGGSSPTAAGDSMILGDSNADFNASTSSRVTTGGTAVGQQSTNLVRHGSWGGVQLGVLAAVKKAQMEEERRQLEAAAALEAEKNRKWYHVFVPRRLMMSSKRLRSRRGGVGGGGGGGRFFGMFGMSNDEELLRQVAATKIQRAWRAALEHDHPGMQQSYAQSLDASMAEDVAWVSRRSLVFGASTDAAIAVAAAAAAEGAGGAGATGGGGGLSSSSSATYGSSPVDRVMAKRSMLYRGKPPIPTSSGVSAAANANAKMGTSSGTPTKTAASGSNAGSSTMGRSSRNGARPESQVGSAMRELTGQRVAMGIIVALVLTVLFTYTENDATRPSTMIVLHTQTRNELFGNKSLDAARDSSIPSLFEYQFNSGDIRNFAKEEGRVDTIDRLRDREILQITITQDPIPEPRSNTSLVDEASAFRPTNGLSTETVGKFEYREERRDEAFVEFLSTIFILLVWYFGVTAFAGPVMTLVVIPIERMVRLLGMLMLDPLGYQSTARYKKFVAEEDELTKNTRWTKEVLKGMETSFLMSTILRIGSLMKVGFGSAGVEIIRNNLERGQSKNMLILNSQGSTVSCIFLFCDIRQFTDATECLQEEVFVFTNRIAAVVHSNCHAYGGSANKNVGDAFLLSWLLEDDAKPPSSRSGDGFASRGSARVGMDGVISHHADTFTAKSNQADKALLSVVKISMALHYDKYYIDTMSETARKALLDKLKDRKGPVVQMGFGLHAGKAVQGAIGSQRKIDATYVSESVERAELLETSTKKYGLKMLMSDSFHRLLHPNGRRRCRKIDQLLLKNEDEDQDNEELVHEGDVMELFTFDMDIDALWKKPKPSASMVSAPALVAAVSGAVSVTGVAGGGGGGGGTGVDEDGGTNTDSDKQGGGGGNKRDAMEKRSSGRQQRPRRRSLTRLKSGGTHAAAALVSEEFKNTGGGGGNETGGGPTGVQGTAAGGPGAVSGSSELKANNTNNNSNTTDATGTDENEKESPPELVLPTGPTLYNANVWLSEDMRKIRERFSDGLFFQKFNSGLQAYYARDWETARECFQTTLERCDDGPSRYFLKKMKEHNNVPPRNFLRYGTA